jgi:hypothetical protein
MAASFREEKISWVNLEFGLGSLKLQTPNHLIYENDDVKRIAES